MSKGLRIAVLSCLLGAAGSANATSAVEEREQEAVAAAQNWVSLVDAGEYAASWTGMAAYVKAVADPVRWSQSVQMARQPHGSLAARSLKSKTYRMRIPGAPTGEYVIVEFETPVGNAGNVIETLTAVRESDGVWRTYGYYVKRTFRPPPTPPPQ